MKKMAVLLLFCMMSTAAIPVAAAYAKDKEQGKGQGNIPKTVNAQKAKKAPKNDAKIKEAKSGNAHIDTNQKSDRKGKFSDRAPTWKNGVIVSTNLTVVEIRPVAVSCGLVGYNSNFAVENAA